MGMFSMVKAIVRQYPNWQDIPTNPDMDIISAMCRGTYVRFGTYGEPIMLRFPLVQHMAALASSYTGYTHQYASPFYQAYKAYFMASTDDSTRGTTDGWREFSMTNDSTPQRVMVSCPASKEGGMKTNCAKCGLCSGISGKGKKSVIIIEH